MAVVLGCGDADFKVFTCIPARIVLTDVLLDVFWCHRYRWQ